MELVGKIIDEDGRRGALEKGIHEEQSCTGPRQPREANSAATAHVGDTGMCQCANVQCANVGGQCNQ